MGVYSQLLVRLDHWIGVCKARIYRGRDLLGYLGMLCVVFLSVAIVQASIVLGQTKGVPANPATDTLGNIPGISGPVVETVTVTSLLIGIIIYLVKAKNTADAKAEAKNEHILQVQNMQIAALKDQLHKTQELLQEKTAALEKEKTELQLELRSCQAERSRAESRAEKLKYQLAALTNKPVNLFGDISDDES